VPKSQSNLFSLAMLLESAAPRPSAAPPRGSLTSDSGVIDLLAMQEKARKERAEAAATRTPAPMTLPASNETLAPSTYPSTYPSPAPTGFEFFTSDGGQKRKRVMVVGAAVLSLALVGLTSLAAFSGSAPVPAAAALPIPVVTVATMPSPPPPVVAPPPAPAVVAATDTVASAPTKKAKSHKGHPHAKGPKMIKVTSSGVAP
jgi:hypothetical protein